MIVELPNELTIARAPELRALLLSALDGEGPLEIDARAVTEVDLAGLQVLCAAGRSARARGRPLTLTREARSEALARAVATAGFGHGQDDRWLSGEASRG
jgi:anti-anti-sigma regulatory factor